MLSFLALGGAMLALRAAGAQLGWGFQLQSPAVVAVLAALFTLIGLNLAGVFEFGMLAPASLCGAQAKHPVANDFLSGVLAVVIASPCTAPFMGASLGFAIGLPAAQALLMFAALGFGLALPYLAAGFVPAVARLLPRPGAVDEHAAPAAGVPDVRHGRLAGLGAGPAKRHRRRGRAARPAGVPGGGRLGLHAARPHARRWWPAF